MKKLSSYSISNQSESKRIHQRLPVVTVLFCLLGIFITTTVSAQIPTNCGSVNCTSNDVKIERAYLTDLSNNPLSCVGNTPIANFRLHLVVSTKTPRHGVFINCKLNITTSGTTNIIPVSACFGVQLTGDNNDLTVDFSNQSLPCGSSATLTEVFTSWGTGSTPFCPGTCPETKAKCRFVPGEVIIVQTFPCTPATISAIADDTKCSTTGKTFSATFSAGPNTTISSVKWQIYNTGTSSWDDLSVNSVYTTVDNDNTSPAQLVINSVDGLNGKQYRLFVGSTSPTSGLTCSATEDATLTVDPATVGGSAAAGNSPICAGTGTSITLSNHTGTIEKWQSNTSGTWVDVPSSAGVNPLSTGNLNTTTQFRAVVKSGVCDAANSSPVTVTVNPASVGGSTSAGNSPICAGTGTSITLANHTGAIEKWQSNTSGTWVDVPSSAGVNPLSTGNLNTTTQFRAVVKSGVCDAVNSSPTTVTVGANPTLPAFTVTEPSLCGTSTASINFCNTVTGYTYKVGSQNAINGNGSGQSVSGLAAGSNPNIEVTNTTGGCKTTFTCSQSVLSCPAAGGISSRTSSPINEVSSSQTTVKAYPNPFSDKIKFVITSPISGDGSLDVYNMMGQRVKSVYNGFIAEGTQTFELSLSTRQVANLVYVLRIGDKKTTGKILQINQ